MLQEIALDRNGNEVRISEISSALESWKDRADFSDGGWSCPVCGGRMVLKFGNKGTISNGKATHFAHSVRSEGTSHEPESELHRRTKESFALTFRGFLEAELSAGRILSFDGPRTEDRLRGGDARADVYFSAVFPDGTERKYAFEVQLSMIDPEEFSRRRRNYALEGISDFWVFGGDFMKESAVTRAYRPAAVSELVFREFGHMVLLRDYGMEDVFPAPTPARGEFVRNSGEYLFFGPPAVPPGFGSHSGRPLDLTGKTPEEILSALSGWHTESMFRIAFLPFGFSPSAGLATPFESLSEASLEEMRRLGADAEEDERRAAELKAALSKEGQSYAVAAFGILAALTERAFREFHSYGRFTGRAMREFMETFDTGPDGARVCAARTSEALERFLSRFAEIRSENPEEWDFYGLDGYVRAYARCFWEYSGTESSFASRPPSPEELEREARTVAWTDYGPERTVAEDPEKPDFAAALRSFFVLLGDGPEDPEETAELLIPERWFPRAFSNVSGASWQSAVLSFASRPESRSAAKSHAAAVARIFTGSESYDPSNFLLKTENESI